MPTSTVKRSIWRFAPGLLLLNWPPTGSVAIAGSASMNADGARSVVETRLVGCALQSPTSAVTVGRSIEQSVALMLSSFVGSEAFA